MKIMVLRATYLFLLCMSDLDLTFAYPPVILTTISNIAVQGGSDFMYQFDQTIFRSNKADGLLYYQLSSTDDGPLPDWLSFEAANRTILGTPPSQSDAQYNWTLSAADRDGEISSETFMFISAIPCLPGLYRHFRLRISATNNAGWYDPVGYSRGRSAICSVSWETGQPNAAVFPAMSAMSTINISGITYHPPPANDGTAIAGPITAFQQMKDAGCDFDDGAAWLVGLKLSMHGRIALVAHRKLAVFDSMINNI